MVTTYSTGPEPSAYKFGTANFRRRSTTSKAQPAQNRPKFNDDTSESNSISSTSTPGEVHAISTSRRPSTLNAPRRKLPWLDGGRSARGGTGQRVSHIPGAFIPDDDRSESSLSNDIEPLPHRKASNVPMATGALYTPSAYSVDSASGASAGSPIQNPQSQKSYEALVASPGKIGSISREPRGEAQHWKPERKPTSQSGNSPPTLQSPTTRHLNPYIAFSDNADRPLQPSSAATSPRRVVTSIEDPMKDLIDVVTDALDQQRSDGNSKPLQQSPLLSSQMDPLLVSESLGSSSSESTSETPRSLSPKTDHPSHTILPVGPSGEGADPASDLYFRNNAGPSTLRDNSSGPGSILATPKQPYERKSVESIVTDWAYVKPNLSARPPSPSSSSSSSTSTQSDIERKSIHWRAWHDNITRPDYSTSPSSANRHVRIRHHLPTSKEVHKHIKHHGAPPMPPRKSSLKHRNINDAGHSQLSNQSNQVRGRRKENHSERHERHGGLKRRKPEHPMNGNNSPPSKGFEMGSPARTHISYRGSKGMESFRRHRRQPIARNWGTAKKRITATIACINTALVGFLIGVYAGEVPRIQYTIADQGHIVIMGNVFLYLGLAISTFFSWPLPLLHGRKPYVLGALALLLPLQFPQALVTGAPRDPGPSLYRVGLLLPRAFSGIVLGFANVNFIATLLDLFGASLQATHPHEELVFVNDVRRHGGGMGLWLGIWAWSFMASIAVGFMVGAVVIHSLGPSWGFYIVIIMIAAVLVLNVLAPETRRARFRRSTIELVDPNSEYVYQRVVRGEIKLHISPEGPDWWGQEVAAGIILSVRMYSQLGLNILATYIAWIYAQFVLVIVLLGALLSRDYRWQPQYVGAGVTTLAFGALLALPLTKANLLSRERTQGPRTDSATFARQITWSSHMTRRILFTALLPLLGLAYTLSSAGPPRLHPALPLVFATAIGFLSVLAVAESHGLVMEAFDTSDLQPGTNTKHRLQSMADVDRRRRTNYSAYPRVIAAFMLAQSLAFVLAAIATWVGGVLTRHLGAQTSTGVVAGVLAALTVALTGVMWRVKKVQVVPDSVGVWGERGGAGEEKGWERAMRGEESDWKPVIIGNPSGRVRRMNVLELGRWSRWSEIRRLNRLGAE